MAEQHDQQWHEEAKGLRQDPRHRAPFCCHGIQILIAYWAGISGWMVLWKTKMGRDRIRDRVWMSKHMNLT